MFIDTNAIIEAVRTGVWNALCGSRRVETVTACHDEAGAGNPLSAGYVIVSPKDLARLQGVHAVSEATLLELDDVYADASGMDKGERQLFAFARECEAASDVDWVICSPDIASVRAAIALGWEERIVSLQELVETTGSVPHPELKKHFKNSWIARYRAEFLLDREKGRL